MTASGSAEQAAAAPVVASAAVASAAVEQAAPSPAVAPAAGEQAAVEPSAVASPAVEQAEAASSAVEQAAASLAVAPPAGEQPAVEPSAVASPTAEQAAAATPDVETPAAEPPFGDTAAESTPHRRRDLAESFGAQADRYERTRPRYPSELAQAVLEGLPGREVLDVGIGTGIAALPFAAAGASILGIDVDPAMAEVARRRGFTVEIAHFEEWNAAGRQFDAVIAGQTWHWIDPVSGAVKAAEVLRPEGRLAVFWNIGDPPPEIAAGFAEVYRSVDTGLPFTPWAASAMAGYGRILDAAAGGIRGTGAFTEPVRWELSWELTVTRDAWLDQVPTAGGFSRIPADVRDTLLAGMAAVIDAAGGEFLMAYTTMAIMATRSR